MAASYTGLQMISPKLIMAASSCNGCMQSAKAGQLAFTSTKNWLKKMKSLTLTDTMSSCTSATSFSTLRPPLPPRSYLTFTENRSPTYSSSSDACVDFFFHVVPDTPSSSITSRLELAWAQDPLVALKLVFHLRDLRCKGKSDKEGFYTCISWLCQHHPKTLFANLHLIPACGYYKDLLEILVRELEASLDPMKHIRGNLGAQQHYKSSRRRRKGISSTKENSQIGSLAKEAGILQMYKEARAAACLEMNKVIKEATAALRKQKRDDLALRLQTKFKESPLFADLHAAVADIFAKQLLADKKAYDSKKFHEITFAAKWCPSLKSSYDLRLGLCRAIATRLFSEANEDMRRSSVSCAVDKEFAFGWKNLLTTAYTYVEKWCPSFLISLITCIRHALPTRLFSRPVDMEGPAPCRLEDRLRKEFYVPLRQALKIPEIYMSAKRWHELPYEHVPSVAMTNYAHLFLEHDRERYQKFLKDVDAGRKKVAAGALLPHQILQRALRKTGQETLLAEAQWKRMVEDLKKSGSKLSSSMAVCDVSGSMMGTPMEVCIALGLLVAELSEEPFKNHICTFSNLPGLYLVEGETLAVRYKFTRCMDWNMNTDFQAVFRLLLHTAREANLPKDKMVKRLFVFSDMEFDEASANPWETDYFMITKMYEEAGYGNPPDIVFWNLRDSISTPVLSTQAGVVLVSGFSKNLLKIFLEEDAELVYQEEEKKQLDPREVMMKALTGEYFEDLKVVD